MFIDLFFRAINHFRKHNLWLVFPIGSVLSLVMYYLRPYDPFSILVPEFL
jgi:hypothetical protein